MPTFDPPLPLPNPLPDVTVTCAECAAPMALRSGRYGLFWGCTAYPTCKGIHGAHNDTGLPLGVPGNAETKAARIRAHEAFDKLWKWGEHGKKTRRGLAYLWLARELGIAADDAHFGSFDLATCERAIALCEGVGPEVLDSVRG